MKENRDKVCYDERERETMRARGATDREENAGSVCITRINVRYDEVGPVWRNGACSDRKDEGPEDERRREKSRKWERALRGPTGIGWHSVGPGVSLRRPRRRLRCGIVGCWKSREALRGLCRRNKQSARSSSCERPLGSLRRLSARPWTGPVWSMPLTRTKDAAATFASAAAPPPSFSLSLSLFLASLRAFYSASLLSLVPPIKAERGVPPEEATVYTQRERECIVTLCMPTGECPETRSWNSGLGFSRTYTLPRDAEDGSFFSHTCSVMRASLPPQLRVPGELQTWVSSS